MAYGSKQDPVAFGAALQKDAEEESHATQLRREDWENPDWQPDAGIARDLLIQNVAEAGKCSFVEAEAMLYENPVLFRRIRDLANLKGEAEPLRIKAAYEDARTESEHNKAAQPHW